MKFPTLLIFIFFSKILLCQNFLGYNSVPYSYARNVYTDSLENKYTLGQIMGIYSSPKFSYNVPGNTILSQSYIIIKYDSLNSISFYKTLTIEGNHLNSRIGDLIYFKSFLYLIFISSTQFTYDNTIIPASNSLVILKINSLNGNLIATYTSTAYSNIAYFQNDSKDLGIYISDNRFYFMFQTNVALNYGSNSIDSGAFCAIYDINGNFIFAKNLPKGISHINGFLSNSNLYLTGRYDTTDLFLHTQGFLCKLDSNLNLLSLKFYGIETFSPVLTGNNIAFAAYKIYMETDISDKNKLFLCIADTALNILKETSWGLRYETQEYSNDRYNRRNSFAYLGSKNNKLVLGSVFALAEDSIIGCNIVGKASSILLINNLDSNLNCLSSIQICNIQYYDFHIFASTRYRLFNESLNFTSNKQISILLSNNNPTNVIDTPYQFYLNKHKYPLGKMPRGNSDNLLGQSSRYPNILSFHNDKWLETFYPDKTNYCVGDTIKLAYKKFGDWYPGTQFRLEASTNQDFLLNTTKNLGSFTDTVNSPDNIFYTNVKIPNLGGGLFYLRIRSIGPDRISNLADTLVYIYGLPAADAGNEIIVCEGDSAQLNGNNFNNSFYWTSSIPNIIVDSLQLNSKVFTTDSAYCVLHTKNSPGCENTDTVFIHVIPKINLVYIIDSVYPKCINTNLKVSISTNYNDSIMVSWGDGTDTVLKSNSHVMPHFYNTVGLKIVSIKAIANKCLDSTGFAISVRPPFQFAASVDTTICEGGTANLWVTATGGDSVFNYILISPTVLVVNSTGLFTVSPDTTTNYNIGRIKTCANDTVWKTIKVTVRPPLKLTLNSIDTTICKGINYNIIATATGGNGFYQFTLKKNNIIQQSNTSGSFNITATANEIYSVVLTDNCTVLNDSLTVNIKLFPDLKFTQTIPDTYLCPGESITLKANTNNGSGAVTYEWKDGSGTILSLTDSLQITPFTTNQIILKVTDACTSIYDTIPLYQFAVANGTQLNTDVQSGCVPLTINFETPNLTHSNSQPCEAIWDFGDGNTQTQAFNNTSNLLKTKHVYTLPGIFIATVKLKFKNRATECYTFTTTIEALDIPQIQLIATPKKITLPNTQCTAIVTTTNADSVVIEWGDGYSDNFNSNVSFITQSHDYSDTGHYTIKATAYNKNTCYIETIAKVFHADTFMCFIPNAFTANKDNLNEVFKPVVSYCKSYELVIFNRWGEEVYRENYTVGKNAMAGWNGEGQVADTYVYMLLAKDGDNNRRSFKGTVILLK